MTWVVFVRHRQSPELAQQGWISVLDPNGNMKWFLRRDGQWGSPESPSKYFKKFRSEKSAQRTAFALALAEPKLLGAIFVEQLK